MRGTGTRPPDLLARHLRGLARPRPSARTPHQERLLAGATTVPLPGGLAAWSWGSGPPVLFAHGWEGHGTQFDAFVAPLVAAGRRVVTLDAPGHGASPNLQPHVPEYWRGLLEVGQAVGPLDGLVAHSLGTVAAVAAVTRGLRAARIALLSPVRSLGGFIRGVLSAAGGDGGTLATLLDQLDDHLGVPAGDLDLDRHTMTGTPTLIVHDPADRRVPVADSRAIAAAWDRAELVELHRSGHEGLPHDDRAVSLVVGFLTGEPHESDTGGAAAARPSRRARSEQA